MADVILRCCSSKIRFIDFPSHETLVKNTTELVRDAAEIRSRGYARSTPAAHTRT